VREWESVPNVTRVGEYCHPVAETLGWQPVPLPARAELRGRHVVMRPLDAVADVRALHEASAGSPDIWAYLAYGPFESEAGLERVLRYFEATDDVFFTFCPLPEERPQGVASYMRIEPEQGVIEIGNIWMGTGLQRTTAATEGIYLLAQNAFDNLGYRRLEWKCDAQNARSRRAAERFGFTFEGVFRKHMVVKDRNRDTAWFAITDDEWPRLRSAYEEWLDPSNFDDRGHQRRPLGILAR
jgi:RimJ/RimL family protein N-acetyltransferase